MKYIYTIFFTFAFSLLLNAQTTETFNASGTFEVPPGVTEITVEVWGAGGGGATNNQAAGGGGGGGYARSIIIVTPGDSFNYIVGQGGTPGNNGENSSFDVTIIGGGGLTGSSSTGGDGGIGTGGNETNLNGGNGGDAQNSGNANNRGGGGGGGSATSTSNGNNGQNGDLNSGGNGGLGEGDGGQGGLDAVNGVDGNSPGGGGGGKGRNGTSGNGADGRVRITYTASGCPTLTSVSSNVNDVQTNYIQTPEQLNLYTDGSDIYSFGVGTNNDLLLEAFQVDNTLNFAIDRLANRILLQRAGNSGQGSNGEERHILFFEQDASFSGSTKNFNGVFFPTMDEALVGTGINRGADNVFANSGGTNFNNIERLDYIFEDGIEVPSDPSTAGFPIFERGGNDNFNLAVISELDTSAEPSEYNTVISYSSGDWQTTGSSIVASVLSGFPNDGGDLLETANLGSQNISVIFVSFEDMGLSAGDIIYGYSLAGGDSTTDCTEFLDFTNSSFFPQNTGSGDGGIDLMSGGSFSKVAFIHTDSGWFDGEDPNDATPDCGDTLIVSGGEASLNSNMTFSNISAISGSINLNSNTLSLCGNIEASSEFEIKSGTVEMIGPGKQFIRGSDKLIVDDLRLNNADDLEITTDLDIKGVLDISVGDFIANATTTFRCRFDTDINGNAIKTETAQIDEVLGGVIGNNNFITEQCYPGRRAFRLVSPSATTTGSIRVNWQENASAWDDDPAPGFGTHITGLGVQNVTPTNDGQNGFDWQPSGNPSLFVLSNTNTGSWVPIDDTNVNTLEAGTPYRLMIRGSRAVDLETNQSPTSNTKLRERGNIAVGDVNFNFSGLAEDTPILIGNPYQANVNLATLLANSTGVKTNEVAIWYPRLGGADNTNDTSDPDEIGGRGGFITFNPSDVAGTTVTYNDQAVGGIDGTSQVNNLLQPMQSVFVLANGSATTSINFRESHKEVDGQQLQAFSVNDHFKLSLLLFDEASFSQGETMKDGLVINFKEEGENEVNANDLSKFGNIDENLARFHTGSNELIAVEERGLPQARETLPLFTNSYRRTDYVFVAVLENAPADTYAYLSDTYTGEMHLLEEGENEINFNVDASNVGSLVNTRFAIVFEDTPLSSTDFELMNIQVYPNPASDIININFGQRKGEFETLELFDMNGRLITKQTVSDQSIDKIDIWDVSTGVYILKLSSKEEQLSTKVIIK